MLWGHLRVSQAVSWKWSLLENVTVHGPPPSVLSNSNFTGACVCTS